jgi:hypothetical protein
MAGLGAAGAAGRRAWGAGGAGRRCWCRARQLGRASGSGGGGGGGGGLGGGARGGRGGLGRAVGGSWKTREGERKVRRR